MRRLNCILAALAAAALLLTPGCTKKERAKRVIEEEAGGGMASSVHVADPRAQSQLARGFHTLEQNAWRWTMAKFTVQVRVPLGAAQRGGVLRLKYTVPEVVLKQWTSATLTASVNNTALKPQKIDRVGDHVYQEDIPAAAIPGETATVEFALDKTFKADGDQRELGVIATAIAVEAKPAQ
ncbi:MAG: hypothetical protein FJW40_11755 [Acidobacteria bacterium]|nr:hypothetical protein [Acidobacteriota bacterium]